MPEYRWDGDKTRADRALAELGAARSRSHAQELISLGLISVDSGRGFVSLAKSGENVVPGAIIVVENTDNTKYVSRAAQKLVAAFESFDISVAGDTCLDVGASTGGFTQVLLEHGAQEVVALDVGHSQLAPALASDDRVRVVEGFNARELDLQSWTEMSGQDGPPRMIVADLSFISLTLVMPALAGISSPETDWVLLIKPQFEVGREQVSGGIVKDEKHHITAINKVVSCAESLGRNVRGIINSPIHGQHGNREYVVWLVDNSKIGCKSWENEIEELVFRG